MGREAACPIRWGSETSDGKVILEAQELILRGERRRRVPFSSINNLTVDSGELLFVVDGTPVSLALGDELARTWLDAIRRPPPSLAKKLGLASGSHVLTWGAVDVPELREALATTTQTGPPVLLLLRASTALELEKGLGALWGHITSGVPVWIVYPRGKTSSLGETKVRQTMRDLGLIDTKVASISPALTGLRFVKQSGEK